ncbi:type II secretion system protein N [Candidatus Electrothrix aarhusensis]|uniref:Type II secretion system protein N n=1 Tax=Candidatus Electrothrix aarhusensis TaxID=1859131 RepID=A0A444IYJ6_9BACT|nr:type II secretion system protein N [Candidatus Electrothrix aarhusensis]
MVIKLLKFLGYFLYTIVVVSLLLWYKFPADAFKNRIEKDLNSMTPTLQWVVEEIALLPPFNVQLRNISITGKEEEQVLLVVKTMNLRPDFIAWKKTGNIAAKYKLNILNGTVAGRLGLAKDRSGLEYDGAMQEVKIDNKELALIQQEYQRTVRGTLSGNFSGVRALKKNTHSFKGNFTFTKGEISLQKPVLGMKQLGFDRITTKLNFATGTISLSEGKITAPIFAADFKGNIHTAVPCRRSRIQLTGSFQPKPEFTASADSPSLVNMLKREILKGSLPFSVNGLLQEPGIVFTSLPPAFNRQMGLQRKQQRQLPRRSR